jgi:hypothetical protein
MLRHLLIASILMAASPAFAAGEYSVYSPTDLDHCQQQDDDHDLAWRCPGAGGYVADFVDHGPWLYVAILKSSQQMTDSIPWPPAGAGMGPRLEWRMRGNRVLAAILRIVKLDQPTATCSAETTHTLKIERGFTCANASIGRYLLVIDPSRNCVMAMIRANTRDANERARRIADGGGRQCPGDSFVLPAAE